MLRRDAPALYWARIVLRSRGGCAIDIVLTVIEQPVLVELFSIPLTATLRLSATDRMPKKQSR